MTEQERNKLAEIIAEKVFQLIKERQRELDEQFFRQAKEAGHDIKIDFPSEVKEDIFGNKKEMSNEDYYMAELARLLTLQESYIEKENYEKAARVRDKIIRIEQILKNL